MHKRTPGLLVVVILVLSAGCLHLRDDLPGPCDLPDADQSTCKGNKTDPARPGKTDASLPDRPAPGTELMPPGEGQPPAPPPTDPGCDAGFHRCEGTCKDSKSADHCGL
jgi:hypothetical protein